MCHVTFRHPVTRIVLAADGRHAVIGALLNGMAAGWLAAMAWDATGKERRP